MKFLVLYREDTTRSAQLPPPALLEMVEGTAQWMTEIKKSRKATEAAFMNPSHGGMAVFDVASAAELMGLAESCPAVPFCNLEVIPLIDEKEWLPEFAKVKQHAAAMMEKLAAYMPKK